MTKLEELKAAYEAATPGEWLVPISTSYSDCTIEGRTPINKNPVHIARVYGDGGTTIFKRASPEKQANAAFIALAHNNMPLLLEAMEFMRTVSIYATSDEVDESVRNAEGRDVTLDHLIKRARFKVEKLK